MKNITSALALLTAVSVSLASFSVAADKKNPTPEERAVEFRQSVFQGMAWKMGKLARASAMGDQAKFTAAANEMAFYATQVHEGFLPNSLVGDSIALPEVWEDMEGFKKQNEKFSEAVAELQSPDYDFKGFDVKDFGSKNCGGCHRKFKEKDS